MIELSTELKCEYFPLCSGCEIQGKVSAPSVWQELKEFFRVTLNEHSVPLVVKEITGWRGRSKLAVRGTEIRPKIGLFKRGSHDVVSIPNCPLHHPSINLVCEQIRSALVQRKIEPYNELTGRGMLRYLQLVVNRQTNKVQLTLVINHSAVNPVLLSFVKQLYNLRMLESVWINFQTERTNLIFGEKWLLSMGEPYLWEQLDQVQCAFHPACFGQAHLSIYEEVLKRIRQWVGLKQRVLELYAGVGTIGLNLVAQSKEVLCTEINPYAADCFEQSRLRLSSDLQKKIGLQILSSELSVGLLAKKDVIIVDPPRKGLEPKVLEALCQAQDACQLIYLSCGPQSFQRDAQQLIKHGWKIEKAAGYLFFPGCNHVEVLCSFKK
jgi:23S rRNA (uracil1939-C5)-methyltransferase